MPKEVTSGEKKERHSGGVETGFVENEDNHTSHNNKIYKVKFLQLN